MCFTRRCCLIVLSLTAILGMDVSVFSQDVSSNSAEKTIHEKVRIALSRIDSESPEERLEGQSILKTGLNSPDDKQRSIMGLILIHIRDNNVDAIDRFLEKHDRLLDTKENVSRCFLLRVQLWRDIYREDAKAADVHFRELVLLSLQPELDESVQRANGTYLGTVIGSHPCLSEHPLLSQEVIEKAHTALDKRSTRTFHGAYAMAHGQAMQMANQLETWKSLHAEDSIEQKLDVVRASLVSLRASQKELRSQIEVNLAELKSQQARLDKLESAERSLRKELDQLNRYWENNRQIHDPVEPLEVVIAQQVPKQERKKTGTRRVKTTRTVRDPKAVGGQRKEEYWKQEDVYEWVSRPVQDVERDIARIYVPLKNQYDEWVRLKNDTLSKQAKASKELDDCKAEQLLAKEAIKNASRYRNELRDTQADLDRHEYRDTLIEASLESKGTLGPMHPSLLPLVRLSEEKAILLKSMGDRVSR